MKHADRLRDIIRSNHGTLGRPRSLALSKDGRRLWFARSGGGFDRLHDLWVANIDLDRAAFDEQCIVRAAGLLDDAADVPEAELRRRERLRERSGGITSFSIDDDGRRAVFSLHGVLYLAEPGEAVRTLDTAGAAFDPRLSPGGGMVAWVEDGSLMTGKLDGEWSPRCLLAAEGTDVTWGLADFIAAEEMGRHRGFWWSPDGSYIIAQLVDSRGVQTWHLSDPGLPEQPSGAMRYPVAGSPNVEWHLAAVRPVGAPGKPAPKPVLFELPEWAEYLVGVSWNGSTPMIVTQSRDQQRLVWHEADAFSGTTEHSGGLHGKPWVELQPGLPAWTVDGRLLAWQDETLGLDRPDRGELVRRLTIDGQAVEEPDTQFDEYCGELSDGTVVFTAVTEPAERHVFAVNRAGDIRQLTEGTGRHAALASGRTVIILSRTMADNGYLVHVRLMEEILPEAVDSDTKAARPGRKSSAKTSAKPAGKAVTEQMERRSIPELFDLGELSSRPAELPVPKPELWVLGARDLQTAVLWPSDYDGKSKLPVLLLPYGGPGHARVTDHAGAYLTDQWWAEQGFAVVIIDGRGTPGRGPGWERQISGNLLTPVLEDQVDGLQGLLQADHRLDADRVAIMGWSFGGYLAAAAVMHRPDFFHAAVAGAPVTDWRWYDTHYTERYLGHPEAMGEAYDRCSLAVHAGSLTRPLMLIHGYADDNVYFAHTQRLSAALLAAGKLHTVLPLSGASHALMSDETSIRQDELALRFIRQALGLSDV